MRNQTNNTGKELLFIALAILTLSIHVLDILSFGNAPIPFNLVVWYGLTLGLGLLIVITKRTRSDEPPARPPTRSVEVVFPLLAGSLTWFATRSLGGMSFVAGLAIAVILYVTVRSFRSEEDKSA